MYFKLVVICAHYYFFGFLLAILLLFVLFFNGDVRGGVCVFDKPLCLCIHFQCFASKCLFRIGCLCIKHVVVLR